MFEKKSEYDAQIVRLIEESVLLKKKLKN